MSTVTVNLFPSSSENLVDTVLTSLNLSDVSVTVILSTYTGISASLKAEAAAAMCGIRSLSLYASVNFMNPFSSYFCSEWIGILTLGILLSTGLFNVSIKDTLVFLPLTLMSISAEYILRIAVCCFGVLNLVILSCLLLFTASSTADVALVLLVSSDNISDNSS